MKDDAAIPAQEEPVTPVDRIAVRFQHTTRPILALPAERVEQQQGR